MIAHGGDVIPPHRGEVILLYHRRPQRWYPDASTVMEHVRAFVRHSRFPVHAVNVDVGFPDALARLEPGAVILHYSLFGSHPYQLPNRFLYWLDRSSAYKVCFFQDEYFYCGARFRFIDEHAIDCVFTLLEPEQFDEVYGRYTGVPRIEPTLAGYVSDELLAAAARHVRPDSMRPIDVGYRARPLPIHFGRGAREKVEIGTRFEELAAGSGLRLDIDVSEGGRLYGEAWYEFVASCRYVLGVEAGVSVFDLEDEVRAQYGQIVARGHVPTLAELGAGALGRWEGRIPHRVISPRHFEAAALATGQVLFEGRYSGVMEPMVHYIPLRKDFANVDEVFRLIGDPALRAELTRNARRDLIDSGEWSYARFVAGFDSVLRDAGLTPAPAPSLGAALAQGRRSRELVRTVRGYPQWLLWTRHAGAWSRLEPLTRRLRRLLRRPRSVPYT